MTSPPRHATSAVARKLTPEVFAEFGKGLPEDLKKKNEMYFIGRRFPCGNAFSLTFGSGNPPEKIQARKK